MNMGKKMEILSQYEQADPLRRMHLFLEFRDLRSGFQEIERKKRTIKNIPAPYSEQDMEDEDPEYVDPLSVYSNYETVS